MPRFSLKPGELAHTYRDDWDGHKLYVFRPGVIIEVDASNEVSLKFLRGKSSLVESPDLQLIAPPPPEPPPEPPPAPKRRRGRRKKKVVTGEE